MAFLPVTNGIVHFEPITFRHFRLKLGHLTSFHTMQTRSMTRATATTLVLNHVSHTKLAQFSTPVRTPLITFGSKTSPLRVSPPPPVPHKCLQYIIPVQPGEKSQTVEESQKVKENQTVEESQTVLENQTVEEDQKVVKDQTVEESKNNSMRATSSQPGKKRKLSSSPPPTAKYTKRPLKRTRRGTPSKQIEDKNLHLQCLTILQFFCRDVYYCLRTTHNWKENCLNLLHNIPPLYIELTKLFRQIIWTSVNSLDLLQQLKKLHSQVSYKYNLKYTSMRV